MKKGHPLAWLIPLILLLILIPFIVPSALMDAGAEEYDLPEYLPVELANQDPGTVPAEEISWVRKATRQRVLYGPHRNGFIANEEGKNRGYLDGTISVKIDERLIRGNKVFFTWIQIADPSQLRTQFTDPYPSTTENNGDRIANRERSVLAINGDSCTGIRSGVVYRNETEYRTVSAGDFDQLVIDKNGDFHILLQPSAEDVTAYEGNILHSFVFGPGLVVDGVLQDLHARKNFGSGVKPGIKAQRQVLCQMEPLSYLIITTEGPEQAKDGGFTLYELADIAYQVGAVNAYNLDGGCTTWLILGTERVNNLRGNSLRGIMDMIYFVTAEPDPDPEPAEQP